MEVVFIFRNPQCQLIKFFLLSPLLISLTTPPAGDVKKTPGFLSSKILVASFYESPNLTSIVGFMPIKSLPNKDTDVTFGVSVITWSGIPEIGKSKPFEIFITCVSLSIYKSIKNVMIINVKRP